MDYSQLIETTATRYGVDPRLVTAVVTHESSGNPWAWNPEPQYRYFWDVKTNKPFRQLGHEEIVAEVPPGDFPFLAGDRDQEWWGQSASWGLMQVMGAVARELQFRGPYLTQLADPVTGLGYGVKHLKNQLTWAAGDIAKALSAYNAGRVPSAQGASYAATVIGIYNALPKP